MKIRAVLLDFDGTLIDLEERWVKPLFGAIMEIKSDINVEKVKRNVGNIIQKSGGKSNHIVLQSIWYIGKISGLNFFQRLLLLAKLRKRRKQFQNITPIDGYQNVLNYVRTNYEKMALVTSASTKTIQKALEDFPEFNVFDVIITRDDVTNAKPDPQALILACKKLGVMPEETVMIGDFPVDIQAAKNIGAKSIGILGSMGKYTKKPLMESNPDIIVETLHDIPDALAQISKN